MKSTALTVVAALSMAVLTYAVVVGVLLKRIGDWVSCDEYRIKPIRRASVPTGQIPIFGTYVHWSILIGPASIVPALWVACSVGDRVRRRNRERRGQCLDCGQWLPARRGRCPNCGLRYERVHLRGEPLFPVIPLRDKRRPRRCT